MGYILHLQFSNVGEIHSFSINSGDIIQLACYDDSFRIGFDMAELADNNNHFLSGLTVGSRPLEMVAVNQPVIYVRLDSAAAGSVYVFVS